MRRGFTLIELLVVIAIIALLVSILLPSLNSARRIAQLTRCSTQVHSFGRGAHLYAADYSGWVPRNDYDWGGDHYMFWAVAFAPYLDDKLTWPEIHDLEFIKEWVMEVGFYHCPGIRSDNNGVDYTVNNIDWDYYQLYKNTDKPYKSNPNRQAISNLDMIHQPAELLYICEASNRFAIRTADIQSDSHTIFNRFGKPAGGRMIKHNDRRHDGRTTFLCFDGHAETREMIPENFPMRLYVPKHD